MRLRRLLPVFPFLLALPAWGEPETPPTSATTAAPAPALPSPLALLRQIDQGFVQVYEKVAPSVVVIDARKKPDETGLDDADSTAPFPEEKERGKSRGEGARTWRLPQPPTHSEASGFVFRADGYILTNLHVVSDAEKFTVRLKDGRVLPGKVVASDELTDIAVLKIEATSLVPVEMGDSDALRVGQLVCAIGTPFSQDYSFTCGWVSGKGRTNLLSAISPTVVYEDYIQTDAFINPGNSGGPLFDVEGKVIGMNTLINGIGRGLAFAIPSNILQEVGTQLINSGRVIRPWLGIRIESLSQNAELRERVVGIEDGVVVDTIEADAPAYFSDLRPADIITEIDGAKVNSAHDLQKEVLKKTVGQVLQLTVWRNGQTLKIPVATGELPSDVAKTQAPPSATPTLPQLPPASTAKKGEAKDE
jgi:S1-C subfamily serine protease